MILVGEMRDLETIATALTAAETGHLVFATLHTQSAPQTIDRIIDVFPAGQQQQVRVQLAATLQGVVTQNLVPTADRRGRVAALEILMPDDAVRNLIRQAKIEQIYSVMQTSSGRGMQTMEQSLADLTMRRVITPEVAFSRTTHREQLLGLLERAGFTDFQSPAPSSHGLRLAAAGVNMDLKKEIKLSDLVRETSGGRQEAPARRSRAARRASSGSRSAPRSWRRRVSRTTAPRGCSSSRGSPLPSGIVVSGEVRDIPALAAALDEFFRTHKLPRRGVRLGVATNRIGVRSFELAGIDDERQLENAMRFRAHDALSIPVDEAVLDYHVVSETLDDSGRTVRRDRARRRVPRLRSTATSPPAARPASRSSAVDLEAFALLRTVAPPLRRRRAGRRRRGDDRSRPHDARDLGRHRLRLHARARVGRRPRSSPRSSASSGVDASEAAELKHALSLETAGALATAPTSASRPARARRCGASCRRSHASSSPRSSSTRLSPARWRSRRSCSRAERAACTASPEELERLTRVRVRRADPLARVQVDELGRIARRPCRRSPSQSDWGWRPRCAPSTFFPPPESKRARTTARAVRARPRRSRSRPACRSRSSWRPSASPSCRSAPP